MGARGEHQAASWYESRGYVVLEKNWRCRDGELDLILVDGSTYVFSEVKARRTAAYGPAAAAVGVAKQRRIRQLAVEWLRAHDVHAEAIRFDVVAITGSELELITDAF